MTAKYGSVVVGGGALGAATAYWLARKGARDVLVLEQFALGHSFGASEDHSRIIRHAYHSTNYTALTEAAYRAWSHVEAETGLQLVLKTGGLDLAAVGSEGEVEFRNYSNALSTIGVAYEHLEASEIRERWPQWVIGDDVIGLYQADGGILDIRRATAAHVALGRGLGVRFAPHTTVQHIESSEGAVAVHTDDGTIRAESLTLCVGSWIDRLLPDLGLAWNITLSQEQVSYFATPNLRAFAPDRFPMWIWHGDPLFYGFPVYGEVAVKAARDMTGRFVTTKTRSYDPDPEETALVEGFLAEHLPGALGPELLSKTCVYDMPPDRDFVVDRVPGHPRVTVAIGAGHAGKFAGLIGKILAEIVIDGSTSAPIGPFRADRPALSDPSFVPSFRMSG